jgi:hypothetical protein
MACAGYLVHPGVLLGECGLGHLSVAYLACRLKLVSTIVMRHS